MGLTFSVPMEIRTLTLDDPLGPPHWVLRTWPNPDTTLIAIEDGKIHGLIWMAYAGPTAMIGLRLSAEPHVAWSLCNAARKFAHDCRCRSLIFHVDNERLLAAFRGRGGRTTGKFAQPVVFMTGVSDDE